MVRLHCLEPDNMSLVQPQHLLQPGCIWRAEQATLCSLTTLTTLPVLMAEQLGDSLNLQHSKLSLGSVHVHEMNMSAAMAHCQALLQTKSLWAYVNAC